MSWQAELDELARRKAFAEQMGGAEKVKRQHDGGRLTVRERIERLTDAGSFHEIGAIAGKAEYDEHGELVELVPSNCVFGRASVGGRRVVVSGDDFTVRFWLCISSGSATWSYSFFAAKPPRPVASSHTGLALVLSDGVGSQCCIRASASMLL